MNGRFNIIAFVPILKWNFKMASSHRLCTGPQMIPALKWSQDPKWSPKTSSLARCEKTCITGSFGVQISRDICTRFILVLYSIFVLYEAQLDNKTCLSTTNQRDGVQRLSPASEAQGPTVETTSPLSSLNQDTPW